MATIDERTLERIYNATNVLATQIDKLTIDIHQEGRPITHHLTSDGEPYTIIKLHYYPRRDHKQQESLLQRLLSTCIDLENVNEQILNDRRNGAI